MKDAVKRRREDAGKDPVTGVNVYRPGVNWAPARVFPVEARRKRTPGLQLARPVLLPLASHDGPWGVALTRVSGAGGGGGGEPGHRTPSAALPPLPRTPHSPAPPSDPDTVHIPHHHTQQPPARPRRAHRGSPDAAGSTSAPTGASPLRWTIVVVRLRLRRLEAANVSCRAPARQASAGRVCVEHSCAR